MLYLSNVVSYVFTVNELSNNKTKSTFNYKIKKVIFPPVYVVDILFIWFLAGNFFLTTRGNFFSNQVFFLTFEGNV